MTGAHLSHMQDVLAGVWNDDGPDAVFEQLSELDSSTVMNLLMANIGARAREL